MIIACPACATRYAVPDTAIGIDGRVVRCAKCRHSWYQDGQSAPVEGHVAVPMPAPVASYAAPPVPAPAGPQAWAAPAPASHPWDGPKPAMPTPATTDMAAPYASPLSAAPPAPAPLAPAPPSPAPPLLAEAIVETQAQADSFAEAPSSFAHRPPFRPRRNPARLWTGLAIGLCVVMLGAMGAVARFGLPAWLPFQPGGMGSMVEPDLKLSFPAAKQERLPLPGGNDYFNISGSITNTGQDRRDVPDVLIVLRDAHNRIVYTAEATPPKAVLAPGESESINTALVDAPKAATAAEIHWRPR